MLKPLSVRIFCLSILLFCLPNAYASEDLAQKSTTQQIKQQARDLHLADESVWHKIILFKQHAEVTSKDFYLSDLSAKNIKKITPQIELDASIDALHENPTLICKYPARYYWLSRRLMLYKAVKTCRVQNKMFVYYWSVVI